MTWKRVVTAAILIPAVVAIVLFTSIAVVALATAIITVLALREYFALGDAIGHRAYRLWTIFCSIFLILVQSSSSLLHLDFVFSKSSVSTSFLFEPLAERLPLLNSLPTVLFVF